MLNQRLAMALFGVVLLPSCSSLPGPLQLMMQPVQQVRHSTNDRASGYYRLGRYHQERGDLDLALTGYTYAIARDPAAPEPRIAAAIIHARQGRLAQARAMLLAVCTEYPELVQPRNNLGYVYYLQGEYAAAAAAFRQALALEPANERARNNLALAEGASAQPVAAIPPRPAPLAPPATGTVAGTPPAPAAAPVAAPAPAEQANGMRLVRLSPNMYELRLADRAPAPHVAATPVPAPAAELVPVAAPRVKPVEQPVNAVKPAVAAAMVKPSTPAAAARPARMAAAPGAVRTATAPAAAKPVAPAAAAKPTAGVAAAKSPAVVATAKPTAPTAAAKPVPAAVAAKPTASAVAAKPAASAAAAKPAAAPASAPATVVQKSASRVEIANANGVPGMARRYKEVLGQRGIAVSRLTNAKPFGRAGSSIEFVPGFERQARELQAALGGKPSLQKAAARAGSDLRLVLGKDAAAWIERPTTAALPTAALLTSAGQTASINQ